MKNPPVELNNPNFQLVSTLTPTPANASTGCEQRVCWMLSSTTTYQTGNTVKVAIWADSSSRAVLQGGKGCRQATGAVLRLCLGVAPPKNMAR